MKKFPILMTIMLVLFCQSVISLGEVAYPNDNNGIGGTGFFNTNIDTGDITSTTRNIGDPRLQPFVEDLDSNGVNEIIAVDGDNVEIYQGTALTPISGTAAEDNIDHLIIYDIDSDTNLDIITTGGDKLSFFTFNGTALNLDLNITIPNITGSEFMIACRDAQDCLLINARFQAAAGNLDLYGYRFNSTTIYNVTTIHNNINNGDWYLPKIRTIDIADYDQDGTSEYIYTVYGYNNNDLVMFWMDATASGLTTEQHIHVAAPQVFIDTGRDEFTSPLVYDFSPSDNGLETVIAFQADSQTEFEMVMYDQSGAEIHDYPDLSYEQGVLISNPVRMSAFSDTGAVDVCVLGFDTTGNDINLLCGSPTTSQDTVEGETWQYDGSVYYDITENDTLYNNLMMAAQHSTLTVGGTNLHEIVISHGVFSLGEVEAVGSNDLTLEYDLTPSDGAVISSDVMQVGRDDLLMLTGTNLWYIDDGYSNTEGEIDEYTVNPCLDSTWQQNTTVLVQITTLDVDDDPTQARAILYYGDSNEQDSGWSANISSGSTASFSFTANTTIAAGTLRLLARDGANPGLGNDTIDLTFSVATEGVEFGDCLTTVDEETTLDEDEEAAAASSITGAGLTEAEIETTIGRLWTTNTRLKTLLGILLIIVVMIRVATFTQNAIVIMGAGLLMLIACTVLTLFSTYIMILALLGMVLLIFLGRQITGHGGEKG